MSVHGGDIIGAGRAAGLPPEDILDFSVNINPLGPPAAVAEAVQGGVEALTRYPDADYRALRQALANAHGLGVDEVMVGNGATELIYLLARALAPRRAAVFAPCYADYARASQQAGADVSAFPGDPEAGFTPSGETLRAAGRQCELVWIGAPNNPTGALVERETLLAAANECSDTVFAIDEAFAAFHPEATRISLLGPERPRNVVVLRSLTKFFAVPGLRLGFAAAHPGVLRLMNNYKEPWTVNALAARAGEHLYDDAAYLHRTREWAVAEKAFLLDRLRGLAGLHVFDSEAPFLLCRIDAPEPSSAALKRRMLAHGILIRDAANFQGLDARYIRVAVKSRKDNERLIDALRAELNSAGE